MRRSCFYMGQFYSQRHLNAIKSPLMNGFVNTNNISPCTSQIASIQRSALSSICSADLVCLGAIHVELSDITAVSLLNNTFARVPALSLSSSGSTAFISTLPVNSNQKTMHTFPDKIIGEI